MCCVRGGPVTCALTCAPVCTRQRASISAQPVAVPAPARVASASWHPEALGSVSLRYPREKPGWEGWILPSFIPAPCGNGRVKAEEPYEGRGTSESRLVLPKSSCCPDPGSQKSRSQQPWGRTYPTRPSAPCPAFPTSSEQLQLFTSQCSYSKRSFTSFPFQGIKTPFQRERRGGNNQKERKRSRDETTPFPGSFSLG